MRRALVIGAEAEDLTGVHNDVDVMAALLGARGFTIDRRIQADATRAGILDGLQQLVSTTADGDAVVVYFSGHGGMAQVNAPDGKPLPDLQVIVPTDYDESAPGDYRGVTEVELSVLMARLTARTRNVVLILDCCHAGHMARNPLPEDFVVKGRYLPSYLDVAEHIGMLRALGLDTNRLNPVSNPHLVRLVACGPWGQAYEYTNRNGLRTGLATDSLRLALEDLGTATVTWSALAQQIRYRVSMINPTQRPEAEGPSRRPLFQAEEVPGGARFAVVQQPTGPLLLLGAALLGARAGDRLAITFAGVDVPDDSNTVGDATISGGDGVNVEATVELRAGHTDLPKAVEAHPLGTARPGYPVVLRGDGALADEMRRALAAEPTLAVVGSTADASAGAEVRVDDALALWDGGTVPISVASGDAAGVSRIRTDLVRLARTAQLRLLAPDAGDELTDQFTVDWGRVVRGDAEPLPVTGARLPSGTPIFLHFGNESNNDLYFHVFDLGVAGAVTLVTAADPSGLRVQKGSEYRVGERDGVLTGIRLTWPAGLPTADPRAETILVIVTSTPQDLGVLAIGDSASSRGLWSLEQALSGSARDLPASDGARVRYAVRRLDWLLSAGPDA